MSNFEPDDNQTPDGYGVSMRDIAFLQRLADKMISARTEAGHHPEDILMSVWDLWDHTVHALVDGQYPPSPVAMANAEGLAAKLEDAKERIMIQDYEMNVQDEYIKQLEAICAPGKLARLKADRQKS